MKAVVAGHTAPKRREFSAACESEHSMGGFLFRFKLHKRRRQQQAAPPKYTAGA